jgi:hypothetical protein
MMIYRREMDRCRISESTTGVDATANIEGRRRYHVMANADLLLTIAEIAVAFAGFASLVSVLSSARSERHALAQSILFRTMVLMSLTVVAFSLVPFVTHGFGLQSSASWRIASGLFLVGGAAGLYTGVRYIVIARSSIGRMKGIGSLIAAIDGPACIALVLLGANAFGFGGAFAPDSYVAALLIYLLGSGISFAALLFSHIHPATRPPVA